MSGTNLKCLIICRVIFGACFAVIWNLDSGLPAPHGKDPQSYAFHPACFPDTLCLAAFWSPHFAGFGIQEGMIYGGNGKFDMSYKTQYHRLMSNHLLSIGFPVIREDRIKAGVQIHYTLSALHGIDTKHKASCSGGIVLQPLSDWQVAFYSMHMLAFPRDSTEILLEPKTGATVSLFAHPFLKISLTAEKTVRLPWQLFVQADIQPWKIMSFKARYEINEKELRIGLNVLPGSWQIGVMMDMHRYLGWSQVLMVAYAY